MSEERDAPHAADGLHELHDHAMTLIVRLAALRQGMQLYDVNNATITATLEDIAVAAGAAERLTGEPVTLALSGHAFLLNRRLVRLDFVAYQRADALRQLWRSIGMGQLALPAGVTADQLRPFVVEWVAALDDPSRAQALLSRELEGVVARPPSAEQQRRLSGDELLLRTVCALVVLTRQLARKLRQQQPVPLLRIKRAMLLVVDALAEQRRRQLMLALLQRPELNRDLAGHLVRTAITSLLLGRKLGLDRAQLLTLGLAALYHDLPKAGLKDATLGALERHESLSPGDRQKLAQHWMSSVGALVRAMRRSDECFTRAVVCFEAQAEFTRDDLHEGDPPRTTLSRLVRLADRIATASWARVDRLPVDPLTALQQAVNDGAARGLVKVWIGAVGLLPVGSAVQLAGGELAIVCAPGSTPDRPRLRPVGDASGTRVAADEVLDLSQRPELQIARALPCCALAVNPVAALEQA